MLRHGLRAFVALSTLMLAQPVWADAAKPLAGQTISVLLPSGQRPGLAEDFEKETGIHVDLQSLSWNDIRAKLVTALLAGSAPADVTEVDWSWTGQFGAAGWYAPLDGLLDEATVRDIATSPIFRYDGKLIALPYNNDFRVLIVNKEHFDKAGISAMPKTLDELLAAARTLKEKGVSKYPIGIPLSPAEGTSTAWYLLTKAFGGELFDKDFKPLFTDPSSAGHKALAFEIDALKQGLIDPAAPGLIDMDVHQLFMDGQVSMEICGEVGRLALFNDASKSKVAGKAVAALFPTASGVTRSLGLPEAMGIPVTSQKKEAALAFVKWMSAKEQQLKNYTEAGTLATRTSALEDLNKAGKLESGKVLIEQASTAGGLFPQGTPIWYPQFSSAVYTAINQAAKGQLSVDDALKQIADETERAMQQ
ncbi:ABC transporter substrate-binding protein [Labrys sedimenti]|uniref:ABC transporter substrate-binding protein n=1 Tax=Labrys sedimenti TaxID=3106036 RepID=UPI003CD0A1FD